MGRVFAVASGKGGVGKTTTVANLGAALAANGHETVAVDADLGMGNLAGALGVDVDAGPTLHDVLSGSADADEALRETSSGLSVLPASDDLDDFGSADPANLAAVCEDLEAAFVLIDTSAGLSHDSVEPLRIADEVLLVSTPERGALGDTAKTREVADRFGTTLAGAVLTRVVRESDADERGQGDGATAEGDGVSTNRDAVAAAADRLGVEVRGTIPEDPAVSVAAEAGEPLVVAAPTAPATDAYRRLAADLSGDSSLVPDDAPAEDGATAEGDDGATAAESDADEAGHAETAAEDGDGTDDGEATVADDGDDGDETEDATAGDETTATGDQTADDAEKATAEDGGRSGFLRWLFR